MPTAMIWFGMLGLLGKRGEEMATYICPVCGLTVKVEICKGVVTLFNEEGDYHSCGKEGGGDEGNNT